MRGDGMSDCRLFVATAVASAVEDGGGLQESIKESKNAGSDLESEDGGDGVNYSANYVMDTVFPTFDDAVKWADAVSINLGFILVKSSYNKTRDGRPYRYLRCDQGRKSKPRDFENAIREDTKTKANGCPFYIKIYYEFITDGWKIRAKNDETGTYNHPMIVYQEGHRKISGLSPDAKKVVCDMTKSKVAPRNIMAIIAEQFPDDHPNIRHIYNCRNDLRSEMSKGRGVVQQFFHLARQSQYIYWVMADELDDLQHAYRELGLCAALREVFPGTSHLLCSWHINKAVDARVTDMFKNNKIGASFKNGKRKRIMDATTEADYNVAVDTMKARWASYPAVITYVERTWLCHKIKFVTFWMNQVLHFGSTSSCRVESQHSTVVKTWFESSTSSLDTVWAREHCHIGNQIIAIRNGLEASRSKIGEKYRQLPLSRINGKIHDLLVAQSGLYIRQIHPFWKTLVIGDGVDILVFVNDSTEEAAHFSFPEELHPDHTNLEEPHVKHNVRGRRRNNDTRRDPCYFEHVNRRNTQRGTQQTCTTSEDQCDISQCRHLHLLPGPMLPYITAWKDIIGDGNCGFRCVADFFFGDQAQWFTAREIIANEVAAHPMLYERIYGIGRVWMNAERIRWDGEAVDSRH
ncbi:uncharacterized protein LOC110734920 [Chenopodium quinoa]|uniref:uncharacterized protein LOC110734920 n=1 Tax=Chenopodium quinoa TaxID=63459 RepID=UPI000B785CC6|nr:uncharacterized protein LOC110734920 [Chenopodium quinoa]